MYTTEDCCFRLHTRGCLSPLSVMSNDAAAPGATANTHTPSIRRTHCTSTPTPRIQSRCRYLPENRLQQSHFHSSYRSVPPSLVVQDAYGRLTLSMGCTPSMDECVSTADTILPKRGLERRSVGNVHTVNANVNGDIIVLHRLGSGKIVYTSKQRMYLVNCSLPHSYA